MKKEINKFLGWILVSHNKIQNKVKKFTTKIAQKSDHKSKTDKKTMREKFFISFHFDDKENYWKTLINLCAFTINSLLEDISFSQNLTST